MPPSSYFQQWPEFPSNVPVANMSRISFKNLQSNNSNESARLFDACRDQGHFLLDLKDSNNGETLSSEAGSMMDVGRETLDLDQQILDTFMYKPPKRMIQAISDSSNPDGRIDSVEFFAISQDDAVGNKQPLTNPQPVEHDRDNINSFFEHAHGALDLIHSHLDMMMGLAPGTLEALSSINKLLTQALECCALDPNQSKRSLSPSTTIHKLAQLHYCSPFVVAYRPEPGCVIVLIGDTMAAATRSGLGYFLRPSHTTRMSRLVSYNGTIPMLAPGEVGDERGVRNGRSGKRMEM
ncbi:uncharacterized protein EAF02_004768 [Botrytis sinoallii]|uniref:uncharacterized protein n=1 Tax=Botrytis sinoallii TaxID=1463999 RepID=UPI00190243BC|nr:uncharacterized protein EAF02_004768 [Botrytis sinoallii]KAF7884432.1 hypothetical protein EAF02_004768 [Botrytis sinoallii]